MQSISLSDYKNEELWNVLTHFSGFIMSVIGIPFLFYFDSKTTSLSTLSVILFSFGLLFVYLSSSIYHFVINPKINSFKLIKITKNKKKISFKEQLHKKIKYLKGDLNLKIFGNNVDELVKKYAKDETFFQNRYINHPYYKYKIYLIYSFKNVVGFFVIRVCKFKKSKALRIVDFFGHEEALVGINFALEKLLVETKAEYIDFYEYGIKNSIMLKSGFNKNIFDNKIIIPNYFEPFVKRNIKLGWAIKTNNSIMTPMFKGDCDQDRPSLLGSKKLKNKNNL